MTSIIICLSAQQIKNIKNGDQTSIVIADAPKSEGATRIILGQAGMNGEDGKLVGECISETQRVWHIGGIIPDDLTRAACTDTWSIRGISRNGQKPVTEYLISNVLMWSEAKDVTAFKRKGKPIATMPRSWSHIDCDGLSGGTQP